ncbi:MAG TPA: response regulator [Rhizomicrobium sp.]|nr:response regulator [Rhizomicrobium sp.]
MMTSTAARTAPSDDQSLHILIVEDERGVREPLAQYLQRNQCRVMQATSAQEARRLLARHVFDLIVLDIMMPGEDGLSLCRHIRSGIDVPVILLSAKSEDTDRIVGLEVGADDYLVKPFNPRELLARMKAIVRRARAMPKSQRLPDARSFIFGTWTLRTAERELIDGNGVRTPLSTGEFRLLLQFLLHPRTVLSREQLIEVTQGREAGLFDRSIDNQVARIRKKIEPDLRTPTYIKTVWGGGYILSADVQQL